MARISPHSSIPFILSRPEVGARRIEFNSNPVLEEVEIIERDMEQYGGDSPKDPLPRSLASSSSSLSLKLPSGGLVKDLDLVSWDGADDPDNPQNWSNRYKWMMTMLVIVMTINVSFASSAPSTTSQALVKHFHITAETSYLVTTVFLLGYVFGPLFWGPGSELVGRRPIFIITMTLYTVSHLGQALAPNIQTLLVTRFFSGFFAVAPLSNCGGVLSDMFSAEGRGLAMSLIAAGIFMGPVLGPLVSGFILGSGVPWQWVFWVMMIFAGVCTVITIIFLPETYAPVILLRKAKRLRKADPIGNAHVYAEHEKQDWSFYGIVKRTLFRPFIMLAMEPILVLITIYMSIVYGLLYALFEAFPIIYIERRGFSLEQDGLIFIGVGIGTTLGSLLNAYLSGKYKELIRKWRGFPPPEERLIGAMFGAVAFVIGIFWLGWTGEYKAIPWYVPGLSTIFLGFGISLIFMSFLSYVVDTYLMYSASAFAANTFIRSAAAAAFPLFIVQMFSKLHINWSATLIGLVAVLFAPCPFLFYKYGPWIRQKSRFAPCIDLRIAKEIEAEERAVRENAQKIAQV
ncbi:hypothetical protein APHAL10511_005144 [Amanita phalloides]|nr:hypothetical protein APHAL10511_005144 [Amanita phalloides]